MSTDARARLSALKNLLESQHNSTQEELREELKALRFAVTQSTISRDLRRVGAIKINQVDGRTTYQLPSQPIAPAPVEGISDLVISVKHNDAMIVILTTPGSASLVARQIDSHRITGILGTIAGDDAVFVAPSSIKKIQAICDQITLALTV